VIPVLAWYGEGYWGDVPYRHLGQAFLYPGDRSRSAYQGFAADFYGNGENTIGNYPGDLLLTILNQDTIYVGGVWNETWHRVQSLHYTPLSRPTTCGPLLEEYRAQSITDYVAKKSVPASVTAVHTGLRCVLPLGQKNTTWYGVGNWNGKKYTHLGTRSTDGSGTSDLCFTYGGYCAKAPYGGINLHVSTKFKAPIVDGWNEIWLKKIVPVVKKRI
jgi:hypothetical protein